MKKIKIILLLFLTIFLFSQENIIQRTLRLGKPFVIQVTLTELDDILILSKIDPSFFTNVSTVRRLDTVEFSFTSKKSGKTIISIDNLSQNINNYLVYYITILSDRLEVEKKKSKSKKQNPLLIEEAFLKSQELINSQEWNLATQELKKFRNDFSDQSARYWQLVKMLYKNYLRNQQAKQAEKLLQNYLKEENNGFLDDARLLLAKEEIKKKNYENALRLIFFIKSRGKTYKQSLLEKAKIYENKKKPQSALNTYLNYLQTDVKNYNSQYLTHLFPVLLKIGELYQKYPINDFQKSYQYFQELLKKAEQENNFEYQDIALNRINYLEKHYLQLR